MKEAMFCVILKETKGIIVSTTSGKAKTYPLFHEARHPCCVGQHGVSV